MTERLCPDAAHPVAVRLRARRICYRKRTIGQPPKQPCVAKATIDLAFCKAKSMLL